MSFKIQMLTGTIKVVTGLHIGSGNTEMHIGGTDNPVIKNEVTKEPYIPGSSLKGKMRSLLSLYTGSENSQQVAKLFGIAAGDSTNKAENIGITRLSFWDCFLSENWKKEIKEKDLMSYTEIKMENSIDRITGTARNPRNTERLLPGAELDFKLTIKVFDDEDLSNVVLGTMKLLEADSLGGSGSRGYGKIKFENLKLDGNDVQARFDAIEPFKKRFI